MAQPVDLVGAQNFLRRAGENTLQNVHHAIQIGIGLIQLAGGKFRVMLGVHTLVAEDTAHLIHALHAAHDKPLQVQLGGDTQIHINVLCIVMRNKGPGIGAAGNGAEDRRFHLHKAHIIQIAAQIGHELTADLKVALGFGIHDQIHIALAIADLLVREAVELLRQGLQGLGEQGNALGADAHLSLFRAENGALYAYDVSDVVLSETVVLLLIHLVPTGIDLNTAGLVLQVAEGDLSHATLTHQAAGNGHRLSLHGVESVLDFLCMVGDIVFGNGKWVHPRILQGLEFIPAHLKNLLNILLLFDVAVFLLRHSGYPPFVKLFISQWNQCDSKWYP